MRSLMKRLASRERRQEPRLMALSHFEAFKKNGGGDTGQDSRVIL